MPSFRFHTLAAIMVLILAVICVATGVFRPALFNEQVTDRFSGS